MNKNKSAVALYIRSVDQAAARSQEDTLRAHASTLGCEVVKVYREEGVQGPAMKRLLADAAKGSFERVVVADITRLGRSTIEVKQTIAALETHSYVAQRSWET
jgi:DNA invertase Pin-like site-specific DNA recombinase